MRKLLSTAFIFAIAVAAAAAATAAELRHYDFGNARDGVVSNELGGAEADADTDALRFRAIDDGAAPRVTENGEALWIGGGVLEGERIPITTNGFTVSIWFKPLSLGARRGNDGRENAMIVCNGTGYYDGWRIFVEDWEKGRLRFELGQPNGAIGISSKDGFFYTNLWNHVEAYYDGKTNIGIDCNNKPVGFLSAPHGIGFAEPQSDLRAGCAGFGIGQMEMEVACLRVREGRSAGWRSFDHTAFHKSNRYSLYEMSHLTAFQRDAIAFSENFEVYEENILWAQSLGMDKQEPLAFREMLAYYAEQLEREGKTKEALARYAQLLPLLPAGPQKIVEERIARLERAEPPEPPPEAAESYAIPPLNEAHRVFIAPNGDDSNDGAIERPFATLQAARDAIRAARRDAENPDLWQGADSATGAVSAVVYIRGGEYEVRETLTLDERDSDTAYRAWQDEKPVFSGGVRVADFSPVADAETLPRLRENARANVLVAKVEGLGKQESYGFGIWKERALEVFENGKPMRPARFPNKGALRVDMTAGDDGKAFYVDIGEEFDPRWTNATAPMAHGYWHHFWADSAVGVASFDPESQKITLAERPFDGVAQRRPFYLFNMLEELDEPGEWHYDHAAGLLYVWLRDAAAEVVAARLPAPFISANGARRVRIENLAFEFAQEGGLVFDNAEDILIAGCAIRNLGGTAIRAAAGSRRIRVIGNTLHALGHKGVAIDTGDRRALVPGESLIERNRIHDISRRSRTYQPAVLLEGCGAVVRENHFHDCPSSAMRVEGNDHEIVRNLIQYAVYESDDQGAIDMWGDPSYRGVKFINNRFLDIGRSDPGSPASAPVLKFDGADYLCGAAAIRLDDAISGVLIRGNTFERASAGNFGAVQIHGGRGNIIDENRFIDCRIGISFSPWDFERWSNYIANDELRWKLYDRIDIRSEIWRARYPELSNLADAEGHNRNHIWRNRFIGSVEIPLRNAPAATERFATPPIVFEAGE